MDTLHIEDLAASYVSAATHPSGSQDELCAFSHAADGRPRREVTLYETWGPSQKHPELCIGANKHNRRELRAHALREGVPVISVRSVVVGRDIKGEEKEVLLTL